MKKIMALLMTLCLLLTVAAASGETAQATKLELDGFTLELKNGENYEQYEKTPNEVYLLVYPLYADKDQGTNYNFVWAGATFEMTLDEVKKQAATYEESYRAALAEMNMEVGPFTMGEPYETMLNGTPCIGFDFKLEMTIAGATVALYERQYMVGSIGYIITFSASDPETLDKITRMLADSLTIS